MAQLSDDCFAFGGPLMTIEDAHALFGERLVAVVGTKDLPVLDADGRILAEDCVAPIDVPPFPNSAVDGYAVRFADLRASDATVLPVGAVVAAGGSSEGVSAAGSATRIFTGAPMPAEADTVFMQEDVHVLPDGRVWNGLRGLRKDNTGYDLKQLLIGAEGTLGVVTAATLKLFPIMRSRAVAVVGLETAAASVELLARAKAETGGGVEAFELMKRLGMELVLKNIPDTREPLDSTPDWYVLIEIASGTPGGAEAQMERLLEVAFEEGLITDAAIAQNDAQRAAFWRLREEHSAALKPEGGGWKHDVSVPISRIAEFIDEATAAVERFHPGARVSVFGHVGDGNLHYDILPGVAEDVAAFSGRWKEGSQVVHDVVGRYDGSISAEHGLGRLKTEEVKRYKSPLEIETMAAIRRAIDTQRIMNPSVLF